MNAAPLPPKAECISGIHLGKFVKHGSTSGCCTAVCWIAYQKDASRSCGLSGRGCMSAAHPSAVLCVSRPALTAASRLPWTASMSLLYRSSSAVGLGTGSNGWHLDSSRTTNGCTTLGMKAFPAKEVTVTCVCGSIAGTYLKASSNSASANISARLTGQKGSSVACKNSCSGMRESSICGSRYLPLPGCQLHKIFQLSSKLAGINSSHLIAG